MKKVSSLQYLRLVTFCRDIFRTVKYISEKSLNRLIQQQLNPSSTRYRRYMLELQLITEKNKLIYPGPMLSFFKQKDYNYIKTLQRSGPVQINGRQVIHSPTGKVQPAEMPERWSLVSADSQRRIFNVEE